MLFTHWLSTNWQAVCGWITGLVVLIRAGKYIALLCLTVVDFFRDLKASKETLETVATNHLPHLQETLNNINLGIADLRLGNDANKDLLTEISIILRERS